MANSPLLGAGYDRPYGDSKLSRSVVMAPNGMVATSHTLAAEAGVDVLKRGGNAIDAAIAANAVLGAVEPMSCGIGGDLFAIVWDAKSHKLYGLNASGRSPLGISRELIRERGHERIPLKGPLSWSVPGCVSGWQMLHDRFGKLPLSKTLAPAVRYARDGFPVTQIIAGYWSGSEGILSETKTASRAFLKNGKAPKEGERMTNRDLAKVYRAIGKEGAKVFYEGWIAEEMVRYSESVGGLITMEDLKRHTSGWIEPVSTRYRGHNIWELPPNGQGIAALQILNIFDRHDIATMGHNSADYIHLFTEAKKLAFADRAKFYADPQVEKNLPIAELISKPYAERQSKRIDMAKAAQRVPAGDPRLKHGDTIYLTAVDKDRNVVSLIQSTYYGFGSGHVPGNVGFTMQNRGTLFAMDEKHHNRLEPNKRPFHTIIPAMVTKNGKPVLSFGVMGGDMQPQGHVQVLVNMLDHGMNVQEATDAARVRHDGSDTPTGDIMSDGGHLIVESGVSDKVLAELKKRGHNVSRGGAGGGYQAIFIDHKTGLLHGGSEARKDGAAIGY
jgi:gamma-glutamyltranspeptidase/glutathione hydrolase